MMTQGVQSNPPFKWTPSGQEENDYKRGREQLWQAVFESFPLRKGNIEASFSEIDDIRIFTWTFSRHYSHE